MNEESRSNTTVSHYRIISKLGAGGMGEVYLAHDTKLDRKVAIKFLHDQLSRDGDKLNRFIQEAKAASALNHPNILTVHEIGEVDGKNYIATELIDGKTLRATSLIQRSVITEHYPEDWRASRRSTLCRTSGRHHSSRHQA
jgi:serine/threonine protein kinase